MASSLIFRGSIVVGAGMMATSVWLVGVAQAADVHVRGDVTAVDGSVVKIMTREGKAVSLDLAEGWKIIGVAKGSLAEIKPGSFIGTATLPGAADAMSALEVLVFPEGMRGTGEGHYPWDLQPRTMMTNATVSSAVKGVDGQTVTLAYKGGEKKVTIKETTPVVQIVDASKDDVKPGSKVFISTPSSEDGGKLAKGAILVGKDGITPPM